MASHSTVRVTRDAPAESTTPDSNLASAATSIRSMTAVVVAVVVAIPGLVVAAVSKIEAAVPSILLILLLLRLFSQLASGCRDFATTSIRPAPFGDGGSSSSFSLSCRFHSSVRAR